MTHAAGLLLSSGRFRTQLCDNTAWDGTVQCQQNTLVVAGKSCHVSPTVDTLQQAVYFSYIWSQTCVNQGYPSAFSGLSSLVPLHLIPVQTLGYTCLKAKSCRLLKLERLPLRSAVDASLNDSGGRDTQRPNGWVGLVSTFSFQA